MTPCPTCSIERISPSELVIHDQRKWLCSPISCPDCEVRSQEALREAGRKAAEERERKVLERLVKL